MSYTLKGYDKWLDPPDPPTHAECSGCHEMKDVDDLIQIDKSDRWFCEDCYRNYLDALEAYEYE